MGQVPHEVSIQFQKGLRTRGSLLSGEDALLRLDNVWLSPDDLGALQQIPGFTKVNASEIPGAVFHRSSRAVKSDGTAWNIISYVADGGPNVIRMSPAGARTDVWTRSDTPALTEPDFSSVVLNDLIFFVNGTDTPSKHDFTTLSASGVSRPTVTNATVTLNPGGEDAIRGVVSYYISQLTGTTEGASSSEIGPIDTGNGNRVDLDLTHGDFGTNTYFVYRTQANEGTPYFVAEATGGEIYTDDAPDRDLGSEQFLNGDPPLAAFLDQIVWNDRVWSLTKDGILYWSDPEDPESNATGSNGNYVPINEDDGDFSVALVREPSGLIVIKQDHSYRVFGSAPMGLEVREMTLATQDGGSLGAPSPSAIAGIDQGIALYWRRGVYLLAGSQVQEISASIRDDIAGIRSQDEPDGVYLGFYKKRRLLFVSVPLSPGTTPTHTYIFSLDRGEWIGRMAQGFRGFLTTEDVGGNEEFWAMSPDSGFVYRLDSGDTFAGAAISAEAKLRPFFGVRPSALKQFLSVDVHFVPQKSGAVTLEAIIDGKSGSPITASVEMSESGHESFRRRVHIGEYGHELQLKLTSSANQPQWLVPRLTIRWHEYESDSF